MWVTTPNPSQVWPRNQSGGPSTGWGAVHTKLPAPKASHGAISVQDAGSHLTKTPQHTKVTWIKVASSKTCRNDVAFEGTWTGGGATGVDLGTAWGEAVAAAGEAEGERLEVEETTVAAEVAAVAVVGRRPAEGRRRACTLPSSSAILCGHSHRRSHRALRATNQFLADSRINILSIRCGERNCTLDLRFQLEPSS